MSEAIFFALTSEKKYFKLYTREEKIFFLFATRFVFNFLQIEKNASKASLIMAECLDMRKEAAVSDFDLYQR